MTEREGPQSPRSSGSTTSSAGSGCFPWTVLAVVIALVSGLFLFLGSSDEPGSGRPGGSRQQAYVDEIDEARQQLFKGELVRTSTKSMHLVAGGDPIPFRAQILGSWRSDGAEPVRAPRSA
ncbi:hypothetical protein [Streptomyces sp. NBC_00401]|uniref:hypothetical protein n=1 Tax=unclassified Streptomyces TaxID=2593676 RepID=UPI00225A2CF9|nr:hypothetical protein [Streptomyces sp. NBC_00401]MCX5084597.1 hypothetical protein [Streptomyces sp. NBC_00401]